MRAISYMDGVHYADPNAYWGNPSYLLEPGDAGYVADVRSASFPSTKTKLRNKMPKSDYVKQAMLAFAQQLLVFKNNVTPYTAVLGLSATDITNQAADAVRFQWEVDAQDICGNCAQQWTAWLNITRHGGTPPATGAPAVVPLPTPEPAAVAPGVEERFRLLVQKCKSSPNYNVATGEALGIEGAEQTGPDLGTLAPEIKLTVDARGVMVRWGWGGYARFLDACELWVDRNDSQGNRLLAIDTTPNYLDTQPLPATPAKWTYTAVYRVGDARAGQWCPPVSVTVGS